MSVRPFPSAYLVPAMACWGLGTVLTKYALDGFTPLTLLPIQLLASVAFLVMALVIRRERPSLGSENRRAAALGILNPGIAYALGLIGLSRIDASMSVVLWATEPLFIVALAFLILKERITARSAVLLTLAIVGVLLIVGAPKGTAPIVGVVLTLAAVVACALYSVLLRHMHLTDGTVAIVFLQQAVALAFALIVFAIATAVQQPTQPTPTPLEIIAAFTAGVLYYGAAFWLYVSGLRLTTATRAGMYLTLIPVFGVAFSYLLLDERLDAMQITGALLVLGAIGALSQLDADTTHVGRL
jgi:probable blue pigment (indigoidine) exporter